jgi:phosphoribosylamine--glycine ligase
MENEAKLKILIIGSGGREHAVGWKVAQSRLAGELFFAPGNAGTLALGQNIPLKATDIPGLLDFATKANIDLTLALPDDPLALGIVNEFQKAGLRIWGPTKEAAKIEWSKAYAKEFMKAHSIPTAKYEVFTDYEAAVKYLETKSFPIVIKASGLALGKGVTVAENMEEAANALSDSFINKIFGAAGEEVVIEEFLEGIEISVHAFSDGINWKMFPSSQDHKRIFEGNKGPNTGGMGTITPLPFVSATTMDQISEEIIGRAISAMNKEGTPFIGCLYPGIMLTKDGPKVFEFNARLGDPETESYMRILDTDFLEIILASLDGKLANLEIKWNDLSACNIAIASGGYPGAYNKGEKILGINEAEAMKDIVVFHAGTTQKDNEILTNGGRVLGISATGENLKVALDKAYAAIEKINFKGMQYRKDIGELALSLETNYGK